jgi:hypothetical protein
MNVGTGPVPLLPLKMVMGNLPGQRELGTVVSKTTLTRLLNYHPTSKPPRCACHMHISEKLRVYRPILNAPAGWPQPIQSEANCMVTETVERCNSIARVFPGGLGQDIYHYVIVCKTCGPVQLLSTAIAMHLKQNSNPRLVLC